jgi:hypothetical protein
MYIHKNTLCAIILISAILFNGCATTYAPDNWLPDTPDVTQNVYGGWITVITEPDSLYPNEKWMQYGGELISLDDNDIYLLYDSLYQIPKKKIRNSTLELDEKNATVYGVWTFLGTLSTISNGKFLIITAPLWLLIGIPATVGESVRDRYEMEEPTQEYWDSINKFARFPQGTANIDLYSIKTVFKNQE